MTKHDSQAAAVQATIDSMDACTLAEVDDAVITMVEGLAAAVDVDPKNAALWREYRAALQTLREAAAGGSDDDTASFLVTVQTPGSAKVRNPTEP